MPARLRFLVRNVIDTATAYAVPASFISTLPLSNVQSPTIRGRYAMTNALVTTEDIHMIWSSDQKVNMVGYTRINFSPTSTVRNQIFQGGSPSVRVYDSTALTGFSTSGLNTDLDIHTEDDFQFLKSSVQYFPLLTNMQELVSTITDASNPDFLLRIGRMWAGQYFEVAYDPPFGGAALQIVDMSRGGRADDGTHLVDKKGKYRKLSLDQKFIIDSDLPSMLAMARYLGTDKECFVSVYPEQGGAKEMYNQMACRLVASPTFDPHFPGLHGTKFEFEET